MYSKQMWGSDRILRVHTVAKLLRRSRRTIRRLIQKRVIPAIRIGRRAWGVRASDLSRALLVLGGDHARN